LENKPVQYVTGIADFYNRRFRAGQGVLIPRPETEELVALILKERKSAKPRILDIGVGSGCIAITLALEMESDVFGTDVSEAALELANSNAIQLGARVTFLKHDILAEPLTLDSLDILVSNPPYIPNSDKPLMHNNVLEYEPETALFVSDDDPLIFYQRIAEEGRTALREGGRLYFEIHENYGPQVKGLVESMGYTEVEVHLDMQGKDRVLSATNSASK